MTVPIHRPPPAGLKAKYAGWPGEAFDALAGGVLVLLLVLVVSTFQDYGISNDEPVQHEYGGLLLEFYRSGLTDYSAFSFKNLYLYGGLFDLLAHLVQPLLPFEAFATRHLLSGLAGLAGIVAVWRLARLIAGPRAALLAVVLIAVTGAWYGAMFNHTKDIPFAAAMAWALYFLCRMTPDLPRPRWSDVAWLGVATGVALGLRVGGLLVGLYATLAVAIALGRLVQWVGVAGALRGLGTMALRFAPAALIAYVIMGLAWPWAVFDPLNPLRALSEFERFRYSIDTVLAGETMKMYDTPGWYVPVYLGVKLPLPVLAGLLLFVLAVALRLFAAGRDRRPAAVGAGGLRPAIWLVVLAAAFPLAHALWTAPPVFTGLRHHLFVVPPLIVLAAVGLDALIGELERLARPLAFAAAVPLAVVVGLDVRSLTRLHPNQYVQFNALVGGIEGAGTDYVLDYWGNSLPEAVAALEGYLIAEQGGRPRTVFRVGVCGERDAQEPALPKFLKWTTDWRQADFFIAPTHMRCHAVVNGRVLVTVRRLGTELSVVKDRRHLARR